MAARYEFIGKLFTAILQEHASDLGQTEIAKLLNAAQPTISRIKKGDLLPPQTVVEKMRELWNVDIEEQVEKARKEGSRVANRGSRMPTKSYEVGVPYYDVDFIGGFDIVINDQTYAPAYLINFKKYERATCWCNITGHSMEPEISHGDMIALREIKDWETYLTFGEIYAIVTKNDMRTVKRIAAGSTKNTFTLIPSNKSPEYSPQEIDKREILCIYEVMGCMKKF